MGPMPTPSPDGPGPQGGEDTAEAGTLPVPNIAQQQPIVKGEPETFGDIVMQQLTKDDPTAGKAGQQRNGPGREKCAADNGAGADDPGTDRQCHEVIDVLRRKDGSVRLKLGTRINGYSVVVEWVSKGRNALHPVTAWAMDTDAYEARYRNKKTTPINTSHAPESARQVDINRSGGKLTDQVGIFFQEIGNMVQRSGLGSVLLDRRGVKSDISHGIGRAKVVTFAAVPAVIEQGRQIDFQPNWKGREYDTYVFAAPVDIAGKRTYVAAVVRSDTENRFYLHEVVDENGNLIYKIDAPAAIQTGVTVQDGITGTAETSTTTNLAQQQQNVNRGPATFSEASDPFMIMSR